MIAREVLLQYPDPNKPFDIETDASDYQPGAVIKQHGRPVAFFWSQTHWSSTQLHHDPGGTFHSVVETLTTFCPILLGSKICVWTDHANLTFTNLSSQQVLHHDKMCQRRLKKLLPI
jgi:hypothetical protein